MPRRRLVQLPTSPTSRRPSLAAAVARPRRGPRAGARRPARPRTPRCSRWPTRSSPRTAEILAANAEDVGAGPRRAAHRPRWSTGSGSTSPGSPAWPHGLRDVAGLPDPVGEVVRGSTLANGLELRQVRVPFGVVGIIYEARPNVTADAAGICLKSGNAVLLRGSRRAPAVQRGDRRRAARRRGRTPGSRRTPSSWCRGRATTPPRCSCGPAASSTC